MRAVNVTVPIPDDLAKRLASNGEDLSRRALEAFAVEEYRSGRVTEPELRRLLGFGTRAALDGFLKARGIFTELGLADLDRDRSDLAKLGL
ncbi:hypothetical protein M446_2313 [Methylobacterium sp. 4-46]|nr:hypothetical protein M446_2313 [Methylobacterium sp. 4-46]